MKPNQIIARQRQWLQIRKQINIHTYTLSTILQEEGVFIRRKKQNNCTIRYGKGLMDSFSGSGSEKEDACFKNKQKQINGQGNEPYKLINIHKNTQRSYKQLAHSMAMRNSNRNKNILLSSQLCLSLCGKKTYCEIYKYQLVHPAVKVKEKEQLAQFVSQTPSFSSGFVLKAVKLTRRDKSVAQNRTPDPTVPLGFCSSVIMCFCGRTLRGYLNTLYMWRKQRLCALTKAAEVLIVSRFWKEKSREVASGNDLMNELTSCYICDSHIRV